MTEVCIYNKSNDVSRFDIFPLSLACSVQFSLFDPIQTVTW